MIKKNNNIVARKVHDTYFLVDIKQNYMDDKCLLYEINEMGFYIWNALDKNRDVVDISRMIKREVEDDIDIELITNDVSDFIDMLKKEGYVIEYGRD